MNLNHRRPASSPVRMLDPIATKADLAEALAAEGWKLERGPVVDKGEWNERRNFHAVRDDADPVWLGSVMKGERGDWPGMFIMLHDELKRRA